VLEVTDVTENEDSDVVVDVVKVVAGPVVTVLVVVLVVMLVRVMVCWTPLGFTRYTDAAIEMTIIARLATSLNQSFVG